VDYGEAADEATAAFHPRKADFWPSIDNAQFER